MEGVGGDYCAPLQTQLYRLTKNHIRKNPLKEMLVDGLWSKLQGLENVGSKLWEESIFENTSWHV